MIANGFVRVSSLKCRESISSISGGPGRRLALSQLCERSVCCRRGGDQYQLSIELHAPFLRDGKPPSDGDMDGDKFQGDVANVSARYQ